MKKVKAGDRVICYLHPEWGVGVCSYLSEDEDKAFVVWGVFGHMTDRKYEVCTVGDLESVEVD